MKKGKSFALRFYSIGLALAAAAALSSCGTDQSVPKGSLSNQPPVADAGVDQAVIEGATVTLAGTGTDAETPAELLDFMWEQVIQNNEPSVDLTNADTQTASFTAPAVTADTTLTFRLTVTDADGASDTDEMAVVVSEVPNGAALFSIADAQTLEGDSGTKTLSFTISRGGDLGRIVSVQATTADFAPVEAVAGTDYVAAGPTTLTFAANDTSETFSVTLNGDSTPEADERFVVNLSNPSEGDAISDSQAVGTIQNDDAAPGMASFSINDVTLDEGNSGTTTFTFTVTRGGETATAVSVQAATMDGTATDADNDYEPRTATTLSFAEGVLAQTFAVTVNGDTAVEVTEAFSVILSNPSANAAITDGTGIGTITNDDQAVAPVCLTGQLCVGASKKSITPSQAHIDGVEETRFGAATKVQKFNLGGFGINPFQNFPDPFSSFAEALTEPAGARVFSGSRGEENTHVRAMTIRGGNAPVVFLMIDAVGAGNVISKNLKAAVIDAAADVGVTLDPDNILFGQTHTHAGADLQGLWGGVPQDWINNILYTQSAKAVREALLAEQPATLSVRQGTALQFNNYRRPRVDVDADADGTLTLLEARTVGGNSQPIGSILQYNAHPVSINEDPRTPHADYIQGAMDWLESPTTGSGGVALYFNGPIADASGSSRRADCNYPDDANYGNVRCRGEGIADAAQDFSAVTLPSTLTVRHAQATLPVTNPAFVALGLAGTFNRYYDFTPVDTSSVPVIGNMLQTEVGQLTPTAQTAVTRITIGGAENGLEIVTIPGEATNTFGQYIRGLTNNPRMMLLGLTQNSFGYIIPEDEFSYLDPAINCVRPPSSFDDPAEFAEQTGGAFCNNGLLVPFTGYEEFVSLGPLTAPMLRLQAYNPLFDLPPTDPRNAGPSLAACAMDPASSACLVARLAQRIDYAQRAYANTCRQQEDAPAEFCALLDPDTPLNQPCRDAGLPASVCDAFGPATPGGGGGGVSDTDLFQPALEALIRGCDILDPSHCLFPFPSDHFTVPAAAGSPQSELNGGTGKRINFNIAGMPRNVAGKPIDPTEWNRNDGYSPGQMIITYVPEIGTVKDATTGKPFGPIKGAVPLTDLSQYTAPDAPIIVLDTGPVGMPFMTPVRHMIWAEIDLNAGQLLPGVAEVPAQLAAALNATRPAARAPVIIRPAKNFNEGHRYIVVLRNLVDDNNERITAQEPFAACLDETFNSALPPVQDRCDHLRDNVFPQIRTAGIATDSAELPLYLAWDFTTASAKNNVSRLVAMRDDAFRNRLMEPADAPNPGEPGYPAGIAPTYDITAVEDFPTGHTVRRIQGTVTVPSYVIPADPSPLDGNKELRDQLKSIADQCQDFSGGNCEIPGLANLGDVFELAAAGSLPPNRLYYNPTDGPNPADPQGSVYGDGLPDRNPAGDLTFTFTCNIPRSAVNGAASMSAATEVSPVRPTLYGHGLLGGQGEVNGQASDFGNRYGLMNCAADWFGFATGDLPNVASVLVDLSNFPVIPDGSQQGMLNFMYLARLLTHPQGFAGDDRFKVAGQPVFDPSEVFYHGNSQGGILGGVVVAASKDINRGVLGVIGMNYSTLLTRSTDFTLYSIPLYLAYQDDLDRNFAFSLMQMLWDRSENNGYAHHLSNNSAMGGPPNQVLLHPAFGDHQVTMWSADVMARTVGATVDRQRVSGERKLAAGFPLDPDAEVELPRLDYDNPVLAAGSALVYWDEQWLTANDRRCNSTTSTAAPPVGNVPPGNAAGADPHECPRRDPQARCQSSSFLATGGLLIDPSKASRTNDSLSTCPDKSKDRDEDGVRNDDDAFPDNPAETQDSDQDGIGNNADLDDDNDGVLDGVDACPNTAADADVDEEGCSDAQNADSDNDGVFDRDDACPTQSGPSSNNGCPEEPVAEGFPLCQEFMGDEYCLEDIPVVGPIVQGVVDTVYNTVVGGGGGEPPPAPGGAPSVFACLMAQDPAVCQAALETLPNIADCGFETLPDALADAFSNASEGPILDYVGGPANCAYEIAHDAIGVGDAANFISNLLATCDTSPAADACALIRDTGGLGDTVSTPVLSESVRRGHLIAAPAAAINPTVKTVDGNIADWAGVSPRIAGNESYHSGEHIYTDFLFDSFGADDGDDARRYAALTLLGRLNDRSERVDALQQAGGDQLGVPQPAGASADHYGDLTDREDGTDLTEVRWSADASNLYFLARVSRLTDVNNFVVIVLADTDDAKQGMAGLSAGLTTAKFDKAIVLTGTGTSGELINLAGQTGTASIAKAASATGYDNAIEASIPRSALVRTDGTIRVAVMTARKVGNNYIPANVAYRFNEPVTIYNERAQALSLFAGNVDAFTTEITLSELVAGKTQATKPGPGYHERQFLSGENISVESDTENGRLQPYGLFVPTTLSMNTDMQTRLTFWTHYRGGKAHSGAAWTPRLIHQLGEEQGNIVVTPRARGTSTWYTTRAHQDVFEVFADIAGTDILGQYAEQNLPDDHEFESSGLFNIDPSRVYMSGYSMGGYATYLFTGLYPDLFAAGYSTSGAVTQGAWTGLGPDGPVCPSGTNPCFVEANSGRANAQLNYRLLENNRHVPLTIHHGTNDELALTPGALRMGQRLLELQYRYDATTFLGYEHFTQAIVDEWRDGAVFMNQYARPENPRVVTYKVVPALVKAVNEVQKTPATATFNFNPDGAYWVDGLVVRTGADGNNPSAFGQIDATSNKLPAAAYIPTPRTGTYVSQDAPQESYASTPIFSPANHSTPYVRHGLEWTEIGDEPTTDNSFSATLTNLSEATLDVSRMALVTTERIDGAVTTDGETTLELTNIGSATSLCVNDAAVVGGISGSNAKATLADAGVYTVSLLPAGQTCGGGPGPAPEAADYGPGILGAIAQFFAELNNALTALVNGDPMGAGDAFMTAFGNFTDNLSNSEGELGDDPAAYAARETAVNRSIEAVVVTGDKIPVWSVPAAHGVPYPYPSGATITGALFDNDPTNTFPGQVTDAHNGVMLYPQAGAPTGKDVTRIAAYKYVSGAFVEIPVQVDERFPYFLANAASDFSVYSGTDEELSYAWDSEKWNASGTGPNAEYPPAKPDPVAGLDHDDEIVFMYQDAGDMAPPTALPTDDADFDAAEGLQEVALADSLNPDVAKFVYLGMKKPGTSPQFADQSVYVSYDRDDNADQWIDRNSFCDEDPEKLGTSNTGYGPNRSGRVFKTAHQPGGEVENNPNARLCRKQTMDCTVTVESPFVDPRCPTSDGGIADGAGRNSSDRFPRDGVTVSTDTYQWRATGRWMVREVKVTKPGEIGEYGDDLIDRWKGRAFQQSPDSTVSLVGFEDEQVNWEANATLLGELCGPVRCIREVWGADSGTNVTKTETFYRDAVASRYRVRVHPIPPDGLYTNWDYNRSAMVPDETDPPGTPGGRYFTALRPNGVPVDGINDDIGQIDRLSPDPITGMCVTSDGPRPAEDFGGICPLFFDAADPTFNLMLAFNNWEQVSGKGNLGSLVYVFELKGATSLGNPLVVPYYRDDACLDDGTGDDPVARPYPGESSATDPRVKAGYAALAGKPYEELKCEERQGAYGAHGVHYFFTHDTDNAFLIGKPITEADASWWQIMVPTETPKNVGAEHANVVRVPVQAVVTPRPGTGGGGSATTSPGERGLLQVVMDFIGSVMSAPIDALNYLVAGINGLLIGNDNASAVAVASDVAAGNAEGAQEDATAVVEGFNPDGDSMVKAGVGVVDMTPDVGYGAGQYSDINTGVFEGLAGGDMDPYVNSKKQAKSYGVQSRLTARAIVIEGSNGKRVVLLKSDNYLAQDNLLRRVGQILAEKGSGIGYDQILHHVSHAHSTSYYSGSPAVAAFQDAFDPRFFEFQARKLAQAILLAEADLQPAKMGATTVRHKIFKGQIVGPDTADDGTPAGYPNEYGDLGLVVMRLQNATSGEPIAVWVNWGEHPEGLDGLDLHSGDFVPFLERFVERDIGVPLVFSQGDVGSAEKSGNDRQRLRNDASVCQSFTNDPLVYSADNCPAGQGTWRDWNHKGYVQNERNVRFLADAVVKGWNAIGVETGTNTFLGGDPKANNYIAEVQIPLSSNFPVDFRNAWVPGPLSHPYPAVANCRSETTVAGDVGVAPGVPDCIRGGVPGENPVNNQLSMLVALMKAEGVPVPEHYDAPSFGALEENNRLKLQAFRIGDMVLGSCACEAQVDLILNFETRADAVEENIYNGFDWACLLPDHESEAVCQTQKAYYDKGEFPVSIPGSLANAESKARMRAQVHNDAKGWDAPEYVPYANSEPADTTKIKGNFTKEELPANRGYKIAVGIGHAGDYNGYTVSYREYMNRDSYRKALTAYGPHTADYMVTRLVRMAGAMNGAPELAPEPHDTTAQADEVRMVASSTALGQTTKNAYEAYYAALPPDVGPAEPIEAAQPKDIGLFNAATFQWRGGSTAVDNPFVMVQYCDGDTDTACTNGTWKKFADQTGEVQTRIAWPQGLPGAAMTYAGQQEWLWTANFEAYQSFPARLGGTPAGAYRFVVNGCINDGSFDPETLPANVTNRITNFLGGLSPAGLVEATECRGGSSAYTLTSNTFKVVAQADVVGNVTSDANGDITFKVSPTAIPRSYASVFPYVREDSENGGRYCEQCSFRPWATDSAAIQSVTVTVNNANKTVSGTGNSRTAATNLAINETAVITVTYVGGRVGRPFSYIRTAPPGPQGSGDGVTSKMVFAGPLSMSPAGTPTLQLTAGQDLVATMTVFAAGANGVYAPALGRLVTFVLEVDCGGQTVPAGFSCNDANNHVARSEPLTTDANGGVTVTVPWEANAFGQGLESLFWEGASAAVVHILLVDATAPEPATGFPVMSYSQSAQALFTTGRYAESDLMDDNHWQPVVLSLSSGSGGGDPLAPITGLIATVTDMVSDDDGYIGDPGIAGVNPGTQCGSLAGNEGCRSDLPF